MMAAKRVITNYPVFAENIPLYTVIQEASLSERDYIVSEYMKLPEYNLVVRSYRNMAGVNSLLMMVAVISGMAVISLSYFLE
jgi:hypothetical protein